ncbi:MAG: nitroreductase family protein [Candidatus Cloacimonetes bacterium]|nr:nitroreductase family protein [Candidatus Cloacimonadota bacterium]
MSENTDHNQVIETLLNHKSIREYQDKEVPDEMIRTIVKAGQQAAFAHQTYSVLLSRKKEKHPFKAPLYFYICVDLNKIGKIMEKRTWKIKTNDISSFLFAIQDAAYFAQNMVIAVESLGLGTCYIGAVPYFADKIAEEFKLPAKVFPIVGVTVGFPAEDPSIRPRYPLDFVLFEDEYPDFDDETISKAMKKMDDGYLDQDYYKAANFMINLIGERKETFTFEDYSWTEHISRKLGQWNPTPEKILEQLKKCGFDFQS